MFMSDLRIMYEEIYSLHGIYRLHLFKSWLLLIWWSVAKISAGAGPPQTLLSETILVCLSRAEAFLFER